MLLLVDPVILRLLRNKIVTLRSLLDERSILSEQGSIFLKNQLSEQAELSKQGGIFLEHC